MEDPGIFLYVTSHWGEFSAIGAGLLLLGGAVVKLTPTKTDDAWWAALMRLLGRKAQSE